MAETLKRLGATTVTAATDTALGLVGTGKTWVISTIVACNQDTTNDATIRVAHVNAGGVGDVAAEDYVVYDYPIEAAGIVTLSLGICASATDTILVRSSDADVNFIMWGSEIT